MGAALASEGKPRWIATAAGVTERHRPVARQSGALPHFRCRRSVTPIARRRERPIFDGVQASSAYHPRRPRRRPCRHGYRARHHHHTPECCPGCLPSMRATLVSDAPSPTCLGRGGPSPFECGRDDSGAQRSIARDGFSRNDCPRSPRLAHDGHSASATSSATSAWRSAGNRDRAYRTGSPRP